MSVYSECGHPAYGNHCPQCAAAAGAAEERAKIVAWLRAQGEFGSEHAQAWGETFATHIEAKEHLK